MRFNIDPFRAAERQSALGQKVCANLTIEDVEKMHEIKQYEDEVSSYLNSLFFS